MSLCPHCGFELKGHGTEQYPYVCENCNTTFGHRGIRWAIFLAACCHWWRTFLAVIETDDRDWELTERCEDCEDLETFGGFP